MDRQGTFIADTAFEAVADLVILFPPIILTWSLSFSSKSPAHSISRVLAIIGGRLLSVVALGETRALMFGFLEDAQGSFPVASFSTH